MKKDNLDRIADAMEWANYWRWYKEQPEVQTLDGTGPPPPPPPPDPPSPPEIDE